MSIQRHSTGRRAARALVLAALSLPTLGGCGGDTPVSSGGETYYTSIHRRASAVPETDAFHLHRIEGDEYVFYSISETGAIDEGRIIVGTGLGGYLRRILSVRREGRFYHVLTAPASLSELFNRGWIECGLSTGTGHGGPGRIELGGTELYSPSAPAGGRGVTIEEGHIDLAPEVSIEVGLIDGETRRLRMMVEGEVEFSSSVLLDLSGGFEIESSMPLATFSRREVIYFGQVPVVLEVEVSLRSILEASGTSCDSCRYGFFSRGVFSAGAEYSEGLWTDLSATEMEVSALPLRTSGSSGGNLAIRLLSDVSLSVYRRPVASAVLSVDQAMASSSGTIPDWEWEIAGAACGSLELGPEVIGGGISGYRSDGGCESEVLASGPYRSGGYVFVSAWGSCGDGEGRFQLPAGVAAGPDGTVYVSDRSGNRISRFAPDSTLISSWGGYGPGEGQFNSPTGVATSAAGDVFVVDKGNRRVQRFTADGTYVLSWGSAGEGPGEFREPEDIAVSAGGAVFITDSYLDRVQAFTGEGSLIRSWGASGAAPGSFNGPSGIACDGGGHVYVSECYNNRVQKFTEEGAFLLGWGGPGTGPGGFACPTGISIAADGSVLVADYGNDRVQVFTPEGAYTGSFGHPGDGDGGFDGPYSPATSPAGDVFVVDSKNCRVQRFVPEHDRPSVPRRLPR